MCGIAGFIGRGDGDVAKRMIAAIAHRGPDGTGVYHEPGVGLAHARLAVVDLSSTGAQPMWDEKNEIVIVYNGEIYGYRSLREELVRDGYRFRGTSDTEVILALYKKYGVECFKRLSGMFALAIYDKRDDSLVLARDPLGKKPLYLARWGSDVVFGSEPKALLAHPSSNKEIDPIALNSYLALDYVPTPMSIWKGMRKLEPGTWLIVKDGIEKSERFWKPVFQKNDSPFEEATKELETRIRGAVTSRLVADVPVGIFLSGGLDSSLVTYFAKEARKEPVHTFSIGFEEASFDETYYAKKVSEHLGTVHHHKILSADDSLSMLPEIFSKLDEPLSDASLVPTYLLSRFAKEEVTVALGGDGGDELFAGYPTFQADKLVRAFSSIPGPLQSLAIGAVRALPSTDKNFGLRFKAEKFLDGVRDVSPELRHMKWLGSSTDESRSELLLPEARIEAMKESAYRVANLRFLEHPELERENAVLWTYLRTYMMDQVMVKVDRASMYASLEARSPLLDKDVVEFVFSLPYRYKLSGFSTKHVLKKMMDGKLPPEIVYRKKKGFGIPVSAWLKGPLKSWAGDLLESSDSRILAMMSRDHIRGLWDEHQSGKRDNRKKLWNLLVLLEWEKRFL